jgi:DNA processing protein
MRFKETQLRFLLALLRLPGVGPVKSSEILKKHADLTHLFDAKGNCKIIPGTADWSRVDQDLAWMNGKDHHIITQCDASYPPLLKETHGAPPVLFVQGNIKLLSRPQIAIVGSRNPTPIGCENAMKFAHHFSSIGFTVTSGLAIGIDGAAHKGALSGVGNTVAVLGNGLDTIYPAMHCTLAHEIIEKGGALVSEFPIGTPPAHAHFPRRNRIISGLSVGVLVIEATLNSGSLITAKAALDQGREVFAIPGSIHNALAKGCHALIRQGAKLVETAEDVSEELAEILKYVIRSKEDLAKKPAIEKNLDVAEEALLSQVGYDSTPVDAVVMRSGLTAKAVSIMLLELELKGLVTSVPGGYARLLA